MLTVRLYIFHGFFSGSGIPLNRMPGNAVGMVKRSSTCLSMELLICNSMIPWNKVLKKTIFQANATKANLGR